MKERELVFEETVYEDVRNNKYPAVFIAWENVEGYLGEPHSGDPEQDATLVFGLLLAGAPNWVKDAPGWTDEHGWGLYYIL